MPRRYNPTYFLPSWQQFENTDDLSSVTATPQKELTLILQVAGSTLHASPPVEYLGNPTDMAVWFQALEAPTRATAVIDWGDDSGPQTFPNIQLEPTKYSHTYTAEGRYRQISH